MSNSASSRVMFLSIVERVADIGADIDVVDVEDRQFLVAGLVAAILSTLLGDLVAGLGVDLAGLGIDEVLGDVVADQLLVGHAAAP